ncbi:MAG TPA: hypothetical protein VIH57_18560, partial [Bacteroidales bacterium]
DEVKQGKALLAVFNSERVKDLPDEEELKAKAAANGEEVKIPKSVSVSRQGFVNKLAHFRNIVTFLKTVAVYKPNETDLTTEALDTFATSTDTLNSEKSRTTDVWSGAIADRNKIMYQEPDGAYYVALAIKEYVAGTKFKNGAFYKELLKFPIRSYKI